MLAAWACAGIAVIALKLAAGRSGEGCEEFAVQNLGNGANLRSCWADDGKFLSVYDQGVGSI